MIGILLAQSLYGPDGTAWPQYRHDYKRAGFYRWPAQCASITEMWDVVHGSIDESIIGMYANGDDAVDIIGAQQSSYSGGVMAVDVIARDTLWENMGDYFPSPGIASVAASDTFVFANGYSYFKVIDITNGATVYQYDKPDGRGPSPAIADVDMDGCPEVYTSFGNQAVSVDGCATTYTTHWTYTLPADAYAPALGDVDGDGYMEVVYPLSNGQIYVLDAGTGTLHSSFSAGVPSSIDIWPDYTVALGDVDGDGSDELVVPTSTSVSVYDYRGSFLGWVQLWTVAGYSNGSPVALANYDGDSWDDVWVIHDGELYIYKGTDGSLLGSTSGFGVNGNEGTGYPPTLVDLTGDRFPDVLAPVGDYNVGLVDGLSLTLLGTYGTTPYSITSEVIVVKLSGSLAFAAGDFSCHITVWGTCPLAYDDPTNVSEVRNTGSALRIERDAVLVSSEVGDVLKVYDRTGRAVLRTYIKGSRKVDLSHLPEGVYIVRFAGKSVRFVKR